MVKKKRTQVSSRVLFQTADMQLYHTKFGDQYRNSDDEICTQNTLHTTYVDRTYNMNMYEMIKLNLTHSVISNK